MSEAAATFSCEGCQRSYTWKPQLAGKRVKCKCGQTMTVPQATPEPEFDENALYDLAAAEEQAAKNAPSQHRIVDPPAAPKAQAAASGPAIPRSAAALAVGYRRGPTAEEKRKGDRFAMSNLMDMNRDVYVPVALLLVGFGLNVSCYAVKYSLDGAGIAGVTFGVGLLTAFKAALLVGFALVMAGPIGVSFGGIYTASLKLAAIAVFADGVDVWIDRVPGGFGFFLSLPVILVIYWGLLTYLFSMDPGDSFFVVCCLSAFDMIVRWALLLILLKLILSFGGVSGLPLGSVNAGAGMGAPSPQSQQVQDLKDRKLLMVAQEIFDSGRQAVAQEAVANWYKAGAKNVWFSVDRDFSGKTTPVGLIVELPKDKTSRTKCYEIMAKFYDGIGVPYDKEDLVDDGEPYLMVEIR